MKKYQETLKIKCSNGLKMVFKRKRVLDNKPDNFTKEFDAQDFIRSYERRDKFGEYTLYSLFNMNIKRKSIQDESYNMEFSIEKFNVPEYSVMRRYDDGKMSYSGSEVVITQAQKQRFIVELQYEELNEKINIFDIIANTIESSARFLNQKVAG